MINQPSESQGSNDTDTKDPNYAPILTEIEKVRRASGGSIKTSLGHGIVLNENSRLTREWITIDDDKLPAQLVGTTGINTIYQQQTDYSVGGYFYSAKYEIQALESLAAIETRFLTFDIWGEHVRTLAATQILDIAVGQTQTFEGKWELYSENEASEHYASIAYIAQVRTAGGRVLKANNARVLDEAKHFSVKFAEGDLEPTPAKR